MQLALHFLRPLALLFAMHAGADAGVLKDHPGHWMGELKIPKGPTFKSGLEIFTRADGSTWASFASPDQGGYDIPVASIVENGNTAKLDLVFAQMTLTWVNDHFVGEWKQGGETFPVEKLTRVAQFPNKVRPQTPVAPFPYAEQTLAIPSTQGVMLGATLLLPKGKAKPTLAILVHGSGPQTRDEHNAGHRPFAVLADHLARQGVAVVRFDKRGVSRSTGDFANHTQAQLAEDVYAVIEAMRARKQFRRIGLIGHSEGPMIAATVAAKYPQAVDFLVSLAGVGLPGKELIVLQDRLLAKDLGASQAEEDKLAAYVGKFYDIIIAQTDPELRVAALKAMRSALPADEQALITKYKMTSGSLSLSQARQPALRSLLMANPHADWRAVKVPVLALNGSVDHQVPVESLAGIVASLKAGGNQRVESAILPSVNHALQTATTGAETEYETIAETVAPIVLQHVTAFVKKQR
ncbi:MAG: alpha/beta fold hydrolase [Telluria sp.]